MDRPELGFAAKECCRRMAAPTTADWVTWSCARGAFTTSRARTTGRLSALTSMRTSLGACLPG
eukprot:12474557-Alexandrium_andersonii.AAC.1